MSETIKESIVNHRDELERVRNLMDIAFSKGASSTANIEDKVVFPLLVSCRDIVEEILFAINEGFGRAALRATRTMYECVVIARHLNLHPEKVQEFLNLFHKEWAKIRQDIPEVFRNSEMDRDIAQHVPKYALGKRVSMNDLNWSGTNIFEMAKEAGRLSELHSPAYTLTSAYIHPGAMFFITNLSNSDENEGLLEISSKSQDIESKYALRNAHDLLMNAVDLRLKYVPSEELRDLFDVCCRDFAAIWGYGPHI